MPGLNSPTGAGDLRYRLTFSERDSVGDEYGNVSTGWVDKFTVSANVIARMGGEAIDAARLAGRQPVLIRVRQTPDTVTITTDWKATDVLGNVYNIRTAVDPNSGDRLHGLWIEMMAETGVAV